MNKKMKKFIKILKSISLSQKEKDVLRYKIEQFISFNPIRGEVHIPKKSFYFSIFTFRTLAKGVSLVLIALIVVGGSGVSYASTDALPGDKLYNVKINVNEKIEEKLAFSTEAKVTVQTQKVERRLTEAQKLVEKKDLSPEKKEIVKTNLEKNVSEVAESIENLKNEGKIEEALETTSKITPVLEAHKKVLTEQKVEAKTEEETTTEVMTFSAMRSVEAVVETETDSLLESVDAAIKKVEEVEENILEKVNEDQKKAEEVTEKTKKELMEKIENLKKENIEIDLKAEKVDEENKVDAKTEDTSPNLSKEAIDINADTVSETPVMLKSVVVETGVVIKSSTDAELKVKEAEDLLMQAEKAKIDGDFKQALILSQDARKIIVGIEEYNKIKNLEAENILKSNDKSSVESADKTKQPLQPIETQNPENTEIKSNTETKAEVKTEIPAVDIKAEAIKSLEETNASLKKINLSQSVQNRLLQ